MSKFNVFVFCLVSASWLSAVTAAPVSLSQQVDQLWETFKVDFERKYQDVDEEILRFEVFTASMLQADELNQMAKQDGLDTQFGPTKFSDLTAAEFKNYTLGYESSGLSLPDLNSSLLQGTAAPKSKSWIGTATTPVKDQGQCGSCWAFSATEQIESMWMLSGNGKKPHQLSVQQIVSCDKGQDEGCNGGDTLTAYKYVEKAGGLEDQKDYPYISSNGKTRRCKFNEDDVVVDIKTGSYVGRGDESTMMKYVGTTAPLSVCVDATKWQNYQSGLFGPRMCGGKTLDHCVQIVGYDQDSKNYPFWTVRNSWNTDWGMEGYIQIVEGYNTCGIAKEPTTVQIKE